MNNFLKIYFPKAKMGGEDFDLFYQYTIRKSKDDLEH